MCGQRDRHDALGTLCGLDLRGDADVRVDRRDVILRVPEPLRRTSPGVQVGTIWGVPKVRSIIVLRRQVELDVDTSAYFTSDRTAIRTKMRVTFAFPHAAAIQKIVLTEES